MVQHAGASFDLRRQTGALLSPSLRHPSLEGAMRPAPACWRRPAGLPPCLPVAAVDAPPQPLLLRQGNVTNTCVLLALLAMFGQTGSHSPFGGTTSYYQVRRWLPGSASRSGRALAWRCAGLDAAAAHGQLVGLWPAEESGDLPATLMAALPPQPPLLRQGLRGPAAAPFPPSGCSPPSSGSPSRHPGSLAQGHFYDAAALSAVWRLSYFLGIIPIVFMLFWRITVRGC